MISKQNLINYIDPRLYNHRNMHYLSMKKRKSVKCIVYRRRDKTRDLLIKTESI